MSYSVFIGDLQLPFNPESISDSLSRSVQEYSVIGKGNIPRLEDLSLRRWNFKFTLLAENSLDSGSFKEPAEVINRLEDSLKKGVYQRLILSNGTAYGVSALVYIEQLEKTEIGEGDYEISIKLVEYVPAFAQETGIPRIERPGILMDSTKIKGDYYNVMTQIQENRRNNGEEEPEKPNQDEETPPKPPGNAFSYDTQNTIQYVFDPPHYDDSALREYVENSDQPIQYTYLPQKQAEKNRDAVNRGLDVFI